MPLTSLLSATDKGAAKTDSHMKKHRKKTQHIFNLHIEEEKSYLIGYFVEYKVLGFFFFCFAFYCGGLLLMRQFQIRNQIIIYKNINIL